MAFALVCLSFSSALLAQGLEKNVRIGILAYMGEAAAQREWGATQAWLQSSIPDQPFTLVFADLNTLKQLVANNQIDFIITNPGNYIELEAAYGITRILTRTLSDSNTGQATASTVIALAERNDLNTLADLKNKTLATITTDAFGGYQLVWRELLAAHINPAKQLEIIQTDYPMSRVLEAVKEGRADAGIIRSCLLEQIPSWQQTFRIVGLYPEPEHPCHASTRAYPGWALATLPKTEPRLAHQVALALMQMPTQTTNIGQEIWSAPADYQSVHELFRELKAGPYSYLNELTFSAVAQRYWVWLAAILGISALGALYTIHVKWLIHLRTLALQKALEEQKNLQAKTRQAQEQAEHLARLSILGEMSGTIAHELNQPLATISNYSQSLVRRIENNRLTSEDARIAASEIAEQAERAASIVSSIRGFSRKSPFSAGFKPPEHVAHDAIALFQSMLNPPLEIAFDNQLTSQPTVYMDELQIQQILLNLMKNGLDAMEGLPQEEKRLSIQLWEDEQYIHYAVQDFGHGLSQEVQSSLFDPFFTTKSQGLGLGLAICYSIAEAHRGHLSASSPEAPQRGAVFTLSLPKQNQEDDSP